jgi:hypothetical protein
MKITDVNTEFPLTEEELEKLTALLEEEEFNYYYPYKKRSGGYAEATVYEIVEDRIYVEMNYGVTGELTYTNELPIDRETMLIFEDND